MKKYLNIKRYLKSIETDNEFEKDIIYEEIIALHFSLFYLVLTIVLIGYCFWNAIAIHAIMIAPILLIALIPFAFFTHNINKFYTHYDIAEGEENIELSWCVIALKKLKQEVHAENTKHKWYTESCDLFLKIETMYYPVLHKAGWKDKDIEKRLGVFEKYHYRLV